MKRFPTGWFNRSSELFGASWKDRSQFVRRCFFAVGVLWGGGMLVSTFLRGGVEGSGAYAAGQTAALVFGFLLLIVGAYYLIKGSGKKS